ncbi:sigma factor [Actinomadura geliboluensis]|uniref:sigma factor n=1 Tax=Actinomadura geliboluensis TaxID=882440 RepID=UPI002601833B|nr:sigma factor [Actinomadura geliboluensis]
MDDDGVTYEEFVTTRAQALPRYGFVLTGNADDAADLLQESLIRLRGAWGRVVNKNDPEGYVRKIMARQHISMWRRRRPEHLMGSVPERHYDDPGLARAESDPRLWEPLAVLPPTSARRSRWTCWSGRPGRPCSSRTSCGPTTSAPAAPM